MPHSEKLGAHLEAHRCTEHDFSGRLVVGCGAGVAIHRSCNDNERFEELTRQQPGGSRRIWLARSRAAWTGDCDVFPVDIAPKS